MATASSLPIVYLLTNERMPGLVKIGMTTQSEVKRMSQLFSTGVPTRFKCEFACRTSIAPKIERALHTAFKVHRVDRKREFFEIDPKCAIAILELFNAIDVTKEFEKAINSDATKADLKAAKRFKITRGPRFDFLEVGIPIGSVIVHRNGIAKATVLSGKTVRFKGMECSPTMATRRAEGRPDNYPIQPSPYWTYKGTLLKEIYDKVHTRKMKSNNSRSSRRRS